ncbi:MAG: anthranilate/aminodeoxychorismate synthase component II [Acidimicrobiaceae bacterium]|nr:anthranilate/aminodeoxychorismate synthase component II [Acidimicrobiaceae bacterium]
MAPQVLVIDNYDSFVYILVQYLGELGVEPKVARHDKISLDEAIALNPERILISPGPGTPDDAGISNALIDHFKDKCPILGVWLGLQCIGQVFGGRVIRSPEVMHGKTSLINHDGKGIFANLPDSFEATRYHSLIVESESLPNDLEISAKSDDGLIMGLRHKQYRTEGVQFHPESILTENGLAMIQNFIA